MMIMIQWASAQYTDYYVILSIAYCKDVLPNPVQQLVNLNPGSKSVNQSVSQPCMRTTLTEREII